MFIVRQAGTVELRQELHVHDGHQEHSTPDGAGIAAAGPTINMALLTEGVGNVCWRS